jgi:two-component system phosphate regulon response regulator PhoB
MSGGNDPLTIGTEAQVGEPAKVVALLVSSPALSSILGTVLASAPSLRVRPFESQLALTTYMRLAPVDLVVSDFDCERAPADQLARDLHADANLERHDFQVIALATRVTPHTKQASIEAGIDEIIVKPMSPKYLLERVLSRLQRKAGAARRIPRVLPRAPDYSGSNVVPLFGRPPQTLH